MRFILGSSTAPWLLGSLVIISPNSKANIITSYDLLLPKSSIFLFDVSIAVIIFTAMVGIFLGILAHFSLTKPVPIYSVNKINPRTILDVHTNNINSPKFVHHHINKGWICNPASIINQQVLLLSCKYKCVEFISSTTTDTNAHINICPIWFSRVVYELLNNAVISNAAKADLSVTVQMSIRDRNFIVTVLDNGVGITQNTTTDLMYTNSLFGETIYSHLNGSINLCSIKALLIRMQGTLEVSSARHFATKITMTVPLLAQPSPCELDSKVLNGVNATYADDVSLSSTLSQNATNTASNVLKNTSIEPLINSKKIQLRVNDCIAAYQTSLKTVDNVNDRESIQFVEKFSHVLLEHYKEEDFNKPVAANIMLMTDKTLTRRLHRHYELGFVETLRKFRLNQAINLLLEGEKVTTVAFDTGFRSASYFTQCFRAEFGFAPSLLSKRAFAVSK